MYYVPILNTIIAALLSAAEYECDVLSFLAVTLLLRFNVIIKAEMKNK